MKKLTKYLYVPGNYPTPMLAFYNEINRDAWDEQYENSYGEFINDQIHLWNIGAYFIYDAKNLEILAYKFNDVYHFVWLLRVLNKSLKMFFSDDFIKDNKSFFKDNADEFKIQD